VKIEFPRECRTDVLPHEARRLALLDETAEDVRNVFRAQLFNVAVNRGCRLLHILQNFGRYARQSLRQFQRKRPNFARKRERRIGQQTVGFGPDTGSKLIQRRSNDALFAAKKNVQRFFAQAQCGGEIVHCESAVAFRKEETPRLFNDQSPQLNRGFLPVSTAMCLRNSSNPRLHFNGNYKCVLSFQTQARSSPSALQDRVTQWVTQLLGLVRAGGRGFRLRFCGRQWSLRSVERPLTPALSLI
jgi:hypothetical protein